MTLDVPFLRSPVVSLVLEGRALRVLAVRGRSVLGWAVAPFNPGLLRSGVVTKPADMAEVIRKALEQGRFTGRLAVAFPSIGTASRVLALPRDLAGDMDVVVNREARRLMNFTPDNTYLFYSRITGKKGAPQVYVVLAPKAPLDSLMETFEALGRKPWAVEPRPLALARAVNRKDAIIAYGDLSSVEVVVVLDDLPILMRSIVLGDNADAEYTRARLVEETTRTVSFYNNTHREQPLPPTIPMFLAGETTVDGAALTSVVSEAVGLPVSPLEPPLSWPEGLPAAPFVANIGLALRGV
ncbi:MAG: hypothetical protein HY684_02030 [Chloroflexi bacterium]|nr:hypothetical protein [Chloroflexota bacterium]